MFRNGSMLCLLFALCLQLMNDVRGTHGRHNGVSCSKLKKKTWKCLIPIRSAVYLILWT